ncbi:M20/M25/M40 family metallo-hydrolase [Natronococcus sp. A-GB7]|uniref:M20/M25/M40 family metallo-hydrolase n=1 Tax=Natronococcus sp. A-GB7 TaxID=3037649 RepID=UPI00241E0C00|nr:M20/M25/M40 family metallo-hydrolase [Natronococcus sp. A-GB7]MDG5820230.1 M20/M25/M40 family metallo-hydrolase [Natronococcus sp. A-GB7]
MTDALEATIDERLADYRGELFDLLAQPSISVTGNGMDTCATLLASILEARGFDEPRRIETDGHPIVYAERVHDESLPTVAFYGHYDVQPPGARERWTSPPFEPTVRDGSIYARGSGDNKGQLLTHVFAVDALDAVTDGPPVNVKLLFEGDEENGSVGLIDYLTDEPAELADVDLVYVADGPMHPSRRPTIIYGNRGILSAQLDLETAADDLHSGNFGGPVPNAANELVELLASMYDGDTVTIDGFHEHVAISPEDRELAAAVPFDEAALTAEIGIDRFATDNPYYERLLLEPTLTINGLSSGYDGEGKKTIIPHQATAKLDCRLVPDQDPDRVFERIVSHVTARNPDVEVTKMGTFPPMKTPLGTPAAAPLANALQTVWEREPVEMPLLGGSLPASYFRSELDVPVLVVPYANPDESNHAPDEHLDLDCFRNGIETTARFLQLLPEYDLTSS